MKAKLTLADGREIDMEVSEEQIKELTVKETYWEPTHNDTMFVAHTEPKETTYDATYHFHNAMLEQGLIFRTEEECQRWIDIQKALTRIRKYCAENFGTFVPDWSNTIQRKYSPYYYYPEKKFRVTFMQTDMKAIVIPFMKSEDEAFQLIRDMESDLKVVFGIA